MQDVPDAWGSLRTVVRTRLIVAILALPAGVAFGPAVEGRVWMLLLGGLFLIGLMSVLYAAGIRLRRGRNLQIAVQIAGDVLFVTALATYTGGRGSQFALFFGLVVVTAGLLGRFAGGLAGGFASALAFIVLPALTRFVGAPPMESTSPPGLVVAYLGVLGVLSGMLGDRVARTRADLVRTMRELDRVRVDNDAVLRHLTTGVLTVDARGTIAYVNPAAEQVLGVRSLECRGRPVNEGLPSRLSPLRDHVLDTLHAHTPRARAELLLAGASGRPLPLGISTNLLMHDGRITGVVAVFQDLTDVREMERRARRNETLAQVGALSARIAHELRNGLNPISGSVECLQRELKLDGENAVLMELISRESLRLNRFVTDLLTFSRERDLVPETYDLQVELAEVRDTVAHDRRCVPGTEVRFEAHGPGIVRADREQMRQVWINLAANAFEAMPAGGVLKVRYDVADDAEVTVEFEDTGAGIAAEDLPRVGQPFFTTKQGGTGLGLAIASRIVERHGGTLTLDSTPGRGAVARVVLPGERSSLAQAA
jgi:two-component system sensor histidine kinase PilS (NtrC family)